MSPSEFSKNNHKRFEDMKYKEMSPEDQQLYDKIYGVMGDRDGNGQSDFLDDEYCQSLLKGSLDGVVFRGVTYKSLEEMPEDIRVKMQQAFNSLFPMGMLSPTVYELLMKKKYNAR